MDNNLDPWNFHNSNKALVSPNQLHKIVYYDVNEIAMGAPLGGPCFLESQETGKIKIYDWCGGPPVWEKESQWFAVPIWRRTFLEGIIQKIGIVDLENQELCIFEKTFRVLDLRSFENHIISGFDSPIYLKETVYFNIDKENIENRIKLNV